MSSRSVTTVLRFVTAIAAGVLLAGCGGPGSPLGPLSPQNILAKPVHTSSLKDAPFLVSGKWVPRASTSGLGPNSFAGASNFKYVGEETLPQGKAWHASAKDKDGNPFDAWIRESDGYPLKYVITQQGNTLTLTFDKYNTGQAIAPPPASQVVKG